MITPKNIQFLLKRKVFATKVVKVLKELKCDVYKEKPNQYYYQQKPNDKVIIFSLPDGVKKIEKLFKS